MIPAGPPVCALPTDHWVDAGLVVVGIDAVPNASLTEAARLVVEQRGQNR